MPDITEMLGNDTHCVDLQGDRGLGAFWEKKFCVLPAKQYGKSFTAHQINRTKSATALRFVDGYHPMTLPDITLWSAPGEHHEIKHKSPTETDCYGLEEYRLQALKWFADETQQDVFYTIHDWKRAGGKYVKTNRAEDWVTANVNDLWQATRDGRAKSAYGNSWVGGEKKRVKIWYWPTSLWVPLTSIWLPEAAE